MFSAWLYDSALWRTQMLLPHIGRKIADWLLRLCSMWLLPHSHTMINHCLHVLDCGLWLGQWYMSTDIETATYKRLSYWHRFWVKPSLNRLIIVTWYHFKFSDLWKNFNEGKLHIKSLLIKNNLGRNEEHVKVSLPRSLQHWNGPWLVYGAPHEWSHPTSAKRRLIIQSYVQSVSISR